MSIKLRLTIMKYSDIDEIRDVEVDCAVYDPSFRQKVLESISPDGKYPDGVKCITHEVI